MHGSSIVVPKKVQGIGPVEDDEGIVKGGTGIESVDKGSETRSKTTTSEDERNSVDALAGKRVGKWMLLNLLGQGGFGYVYASETIMPSAGSGPSATKVLQKTRCDLAKYSTGDDSKGLTWRLGFYDTTVITRT